MKIVVQRVKQASVSVNQEVISQIEHGLLLLVGIETSDTDDDITMLAKKVAHLRIFDDADGKMNLSIQDVGGQILSVSQFTLAADTSRGNRPSYSMAMPADAANEFFNKFNEALQEYDLEVATGQFQAMMDVALINDGPVTILLSSKGSKI